MAQSDNQSPIIVRKRKKGHGHGHHGGAWKVAYADFVTAMMAFFLLLWLIAAADEETKKGLADYFSPTLVSVSQSSAVDGMLGGETLTTEGVMRDDRTPLGAVVTLPVDLTGEVTEPPDSDGEASEAAEDSADPPPDPTRDTATPDEPALERLLKERETARFEAAAEKIRQAIDSLPELQPLAENLIIDHTPEGMRLQIVDQHGTSMFPRGLADPFDHTQKLLDLVGQTVRTLPNRIAIKGHTDATPFRNGGNYGNWELSSDRALASRRALLAAGLPDERIAYVVGKADREPLDASDPEAPVNRRISIILLHDDEQTDPLPSPTRPTAVTPHAEPGNPGPRAGDDAPDRPRAGTAAADAQASPPQPAAVTRPRPMDAPRPSIFAN